MFADVRVVNQAEYDEWVARTVASFGDPVVAGENLFVANCATCHSVDGSSGTGPTWLNAVGYEHRMENGDTVLVDYDYFQSSVYAPNSQIVSGYPANVMPQHFANTISEIQLEQLYAYMCSLSDRAEQDELCVNLLAQSGESDAEDEGEATGDETGATDSDDNDAMSDEGTTTDNGSADSGEADEDTGNADSNGSEDNTSNSNDAPGDDEENANE
jgi:cytochrome c oxidase subunit 2